MSNVTRKTTVQRAQSLIGVWLGLVGILLHVFGPFMGLALYGASSESAEHSHEQVASSHHDPSDLQGGHSHHHHAPDPGAQNAPLNPDQICVGDCPCCSLSERPLLLMARRLLLVLPADRTIEWFEATAAAFPVFNPATHSRPRAPPLLA